MNFLTNREIKLKSNARGFIIIGVIIAVLILIYFLGNFNRFTVVSLSDDKGNFTIKDGVMIQSPNLNLIKIDNISYNKEDYLFKNIEFELSSNDNVLYEYEYLSPEALSLTNYLKSFRINVHNKVNRFLTQKNTPLILKITIVNNDNIIIEETITIKKSKLSSNRLIYF